MQSGHGKMDDRGNKFNSAFTCYNPNSHFSPSFRRQQGTDEISVSEAPMPSPSYLNIMPLPSTRKQYHQEHEHNFAPDDDNSNLFTPIFTSNSITPPNAANTLQINLTHNSRMQGLHHRSRIKDVAESYYCETPVAKEIERRRAQDKRRSSTTHSPLSSPCPSFSFSSTTTPHHKTTRTQSRFLLTFLSSCRLVEVTSRLVVALALTSLLLILVLVMPGAYCSSSTMSMYSSSSSITAGAATKRAYFNQSLHQFIIHKPFQPSSSSLATATSPDVTQDYRNPAFWIKTKWPTVKSSTKVNYQPSDGTDDDVVELEHVNNKLYSNHLALTNDYDNQNNMLNGENISAKNNLRTIRVIKNDHKLVESSAIGGTRNAKNTNNNDDDYNGNNNRSNYYYDSFVSSSSQNHVSSLHANSIKNYSENTKTSRNSNIDVTQHQQPMNRGSTIYYELESDKPAQNGDFTEIEMDNDDKITDGHASTVKVGITSITGSHAVSTNNGTTKAERDNIVNVSSTGIRPTTAFTNSYYGRHQFKEDLTKRSQKYVSQRDIQENFGHGLHPDVANIMQSDQSLILDDNKHTRSKRPNVRDDEESNDFGRTKGESWNGSRSSYRINPIFNSKSPKENHGEHWVHSSQQSHHHVSSSPTATTSTTTKLFKTSFATAIGNGGAGGTSSSLFSSPPSPSLSSKLKSIKSEHLIPISSSSSTATIHYSNDKGGTSSSSTSTLSKTPSMSTSTLSNHNLYHSSTTHHQHHSKNLSSSSSPHHQYHQHHHLNDHLNNRLEHQQPLRQIGYDGSEVISFRDDYDEDEVDDDAVEVEEIGDDISDNIHANNIISGTVGSKNGGVQNLELREYRSQVRSTQQNINDDLLLKVPTSEVLSIDHNEDISEGIELLPPTAAALKRVFKKQLQQEDQMQGDDPSINNGIHRNNVVGPFGTSSDSSPNGSKTGSSSFSKATAAALTFPNATSINNKQKSPLQIRRDLSRLITNTAGRGVLNGGSIIGADDEPVPNKCDRLFLSSTTGAPNGTFESPTMISEEGHLYQCIFMFVGRPMERVEVVFTQFNVRGTPPECVHEWVDIWTEVEGTDPMDLVNTPFSGRYCGKIPPRRRISLYGGIAIGFYSDKNSTDETIFRGTYAFINDSTYQIGTPVPRTLCSYTILGASKRNGDLISPTYPGVYPKNLSCSYKFIGIEGQRIRLEFRDFDVFYGGAHCPFDEVKVYDGMDPTATLIGTYCGQQRNLVVFSSQHLMLVTFTTLERSTESQNRGFKGVWEFSESFVKLDFIEEQSGTHIRGTECDQRILSKGQSSGDVYSPNYPFPYVPKIVCRYFVYGLQDPQHLERVRLSFEKFDVITNINSEEDTTNQSEAKKCGDGFLKVYLKGQEVIQAYDKADYEFCGKEVPHDVVSDGPRLVLVFSSGEAVGSGFKASYKFETEYRVPGTAAPDGSCHFTYYSASRLRGEFNSPRFPSNYPSMTNCTYIFFQQPNEQVRIVFDSFKMRSNITDRGAYGDLCEEDWVEIYNVISDAEDRLVGRYCGSTAPGPIESREKAQALKVILHTDDEGVSSGFKARYIYFTAKTIFGGNSTRPYICHFYPANTECGQNITQAQSGVLTSPKWPQKYDGPSKGEGSATCNWYLSVRPGSRVMLHFQSFSIEGDPVGRGCPAAAVRIWVDPDGVPVELCGETLTTESSQYVSMRNLMRVTFITADKAVGAQGFRAVWTEVQEIPKLTSGVPCHHDYFRCEESQFCIPSSLKCDSTDNCGMNSGGSKDMSDENQCGLDFGGMNTIIGIVVCVAVSLFFIVVLCAWGQRRKRRRRRRLQLRRPPIHVCDNAGARFAAMDSV